MGARASGPLMVFWTARVPRAHGARETRAVRKRKLAGRMALGLPIDG